MRCGGAAPCPPRLRDEYGFTGGYTIVKDYVREQGLRSREVFVPLSHSPGHAQADFGEAMAVIGGALRKIHFLAFDLPHSDGCFVAAYPAETTEAFCDGHNAAFAFFGGVPRSILYDNTKLAVARILGDGKRQRTRVFTELQSHYLFEDRFGRPGKGNDKGKVEGLVGFTLPDDPVYAFCPSYDLDNVPQQIRIVFDNMPGYVPTALCALSLDDALRICNRLNARLGLDYDAWSAIAGRAMSAAHDETTH